MSSTSDKVGAYWSSRQTQKAPTWNWWTNGRVLQHINRLVCGEPVAGFSRGLYEKALQRLAGRTLRCGISVGCGIASKEMDLLASGVVEKMVCYEFSTTRIEAARSEANRRSLENRIEIRQGDAFEAETSPGRYDLVFWNNALHHMPDTKAAVEWSRKVLADDGMFLLDDYVGPNRIQFSDLTLKLANQVREMLPEKYLVAPGSRAVRSNEPAAEPHSQSFPQHMLSALRRAVGLDQPRIEALRPPLSRRRVDRPSLAKIVARDPSEAADSEKILSAIGSFFPEAEVILTGGSVYFAALPPLYANFDPTSDEDNAYLDKLMSIDESHVRANPYDSLYAVAIAYSA